MGEIVEISRNRKGIAKEAIDLRVIESKTRLLMVSLTLMTAMLFSVASVALVSDVALADVFKGTSGPDRLVGTNGNDYMDSGRGNDNLEGRRGNDRMIGGFGSDYVNGGYGKDRLDGGAGGDRVYGGAGNDPVVDGGTGSDPLVTGGSGNDYVTGYTGNDKVYGYTGNDRVRGGPGEDRIYGGDGNDLILAKDSQRDVINCGAGYDRVRADQADAVSSNCERVLTISRDNSSRIAGEFKEGSSLIKFNSRVVSGGGSYNGGKPYDKEVSNRLDTNGIVLDIGVNPETSTYTQTGSNQRITAADTKSLRRAAADVGGYLKAGGNNLKNGKALLYSNLVYASEAPPNHKFPNINTKIRNKSSVSSQSSSGASTTEESSFSAQASTDYYGPYNTSNGDGVTFIEGGDPDQIAGYDTYTEPYFEEPLGTPGDQGRCGEAGSRFQGLLYCRDCLDHDWCSTKTGASGGTLDKNCGDEFDEAADDFAATIGTSAVNFSLR